MTAIERIRAVVQNAKDNNVPVYELNTEDLDDLLDALDTGSRPYKVYTAILNQSGTANPVATVLENTLGGEIEWFYSDDGQFSGLLDGAFPNLKTWMCASQGNGSSNNQGTLWFFRGTQDFVALQQHDLEGTAYVNVLSDVMVEIRVYP